MPIDFYYLVIHFHNIMNSKSNAFKVWIEKLTKFIFNYLKEIETLCETEECLMKATSNAHVDYIYTQKSPPQKPIHN